MWLSHRTFETLLSVFGLIWTVQYPYLIYESAPKPKKIKVILEFAM